MRPPFRRRHVSMLFAVAPTPVGRRLLAYSDYENTAVCEADSPSDGRPDSLGRPLANLVHREVRAWSHGECCRRRL